MPALPRRVLLLHPGALFGGRWASSLRAKPALVSLVSYLAASGIPAEVLDLQVELGNPEPDEVGAFLDRGEGLIAGRRFDMLAVSCWSSLEYLAAIELARRVRAADARLPIVVGGYHATALPGEFVEPGMPFNVVVQGEGEIALAALARDPLLTGTAAPSVVVGEPLPLDTPCFDLAGYPYLDVKREGVALYLSRGCPYRCAFCMEGSKGSRWRAYPVDKAVDLLRMAATLGPRSIHVGDACFACRAPWRRAFLQHLADAPLGVPLWAETRIDTMTPRDVELASRLDVYLNFGVETMAPRVAEAMHKARDGERYVRRVNDSLELVNRHRLLARVYLLFNHPGETQATASETLAYAERFVGVHDQLSVHFNAQSYAFFPGSAVAQQLPLYERKYGTSVAHPRWWRTWRPHYELATDVHAARDGVDGQAFARKVKSLFPAARAKMPPHTLLQYIAHVGRR